MKKRLLSTVLAFALTGTLLIGCGNDAASSDNAPQSDAGNAVVEDAGSSEEAGSNEAANVSQGKVVNIYCWNDEFKQRYDAYAAADDKVDIFLIEADYASKYTKSDFALDVMGDVGLTAADLDGQYQYTKDIVTVDGVQKGTTWQATPGLFAYRRSIAKEVLGTDDPTEVQLTKTMVWQVHSL
uniref:hypothetical protein n=1 Tax=Acetatifactor sp. TaxID=1872090 RepID=UPI0040572917